MNFPSVYIGYWCSLHMGHNGEGWMARLQNLMGLAEMVFLLWRRSHSYYTAFIQTFEKMWRRRGTVKGHPTGRQNMAEQIFWVSTENRVGADLSHFWRNWVRLLATSWWVTLTASWKHKGPAAFNLAASPDPLCWDLPLTWPARCSFGRKVWEIPYANSLGVVFKKINKWES